ncbi:MAG: S8 family serine peptidase [Tychonema bourrellyi B0820]|uniref:Peptidase S8/S53 domain-containing protein n=1 Tax=Tychonema bourrellyi FEM_GT703 TaxID=2040638 RepID=A0A2G4F016_9CYAN|nr:S8 family serine peptidase [Tychonema bourrellyi]MDQ2099727.1 S8 family serine peptidase [Tychonema bourrellyi B0820]PHX55088.1 hypothetical protein CP500_012500 [Tychonema bourrellyi FEM_GT703]
MTDTSKLLKDLEKEPLFKDQWWLFNEGQTDIGGKKIKSNRGIDLNVVPLWPFYTGKGVKVQVIDDGIDSGHEDLKDNFKEVSEKDIEKMLPGFDGSHGTAATGIIAARRNDLGTVGIAYDATFGGYKFNTNSLNSLQAQDQFDVSNNSWGLVYNFVNVNTNVAAIENAVTNGRNKLGTVSVWAAANSREQINPNLAGVEQRGNNANLSNYPNSRYTIAVAAINNEGVVASYSNPGAPLLVSAFGDEAPSIATVDRTANSGYNPQSSPNFPSLNYTNDFNGTSSAAPMVSGVAALILQANPKLGYRDVQEILAYSARKNDPNNQVVKSYSYESQKIPKDTWAFNGAKNWNGGGLHVKRLLANV